LFQQRPLGVGLGGTVAEGHVERYPEGIVGEIAAEDIREGGTQRPIQTRQVIGGIDIERGQ